MPWLRYARCAGPTLEAASQDLSRNVATLDDACERFRMAVTAFTEQADFTGIALPEGGRRLFLDQVFHQTWIAVDEIGTEAAAATGAVMRTTSVATGPVIDFRADHPFLFFVHDTKEGRDLFAGRVTNPRE